ncbi:MAG: hypothetical protein KC470_13020, partial [Dehalococcoidia bacterium]|nr:hypothetical protein [Dehalococcoidia bacterium]
LIYPEGNWVEVRPGTPYVIIGESRYGKPILDRLWRYNRSLEDGLRVALLAFDATRTSTSDVDCPLDAVMYRSDTWELREQRFTAPDLATVQRQWQRAITMAAEGLKPATKELYDRLAHAPVAVTHFDDLAEEVAALEAAQRQARGGTSQAR